MGTSYAGQAQAQTVELGELFPEKFKIEGDKVSLHYTDVAAKSRMGESLRDIAGAVEEFLQKRRAGALPW